jgi:peroxiredoxin
MDIEEPVARMITAVREEPMAKAVWKLDVGEAAPPFTLPATGETAGKGQRRVEVSLAQYRGQKNVMLAFYPAAFTPV